MKGDMDLSVLPNNNHPDKFLQLDVKSLMRSSALLQASLARFPGGNYPAAQRWQNLVYSQRKFSKPFLSEPEQYCRIYKIKHGCSQTGQYPPEHCQFHSAQIHISHIFREKENPNDLRFWLGEMYTPGFDTLLKKEEKQEKLWKSCRLGLLLLLVACILVSILTVSTIFT